MLNSEYGGVANQECWIVLHSPHEATTADGKKYMANECDHIRSITPATGIQRDQDWFTHDNTLLYIIRHYLDKLPQVCHIKLWSDQCPSQYKCRQNFGFLANLSCRRPIVVTQRFAATAQFKGVHDKIGEVSKHMISSHEKVQDIEVRCSSAFEFFEAASRLMPGPKV